MHLFYGMHTVSSQNFEKIIVFCSILPVVAIFLVEIPKISRMDTYKVTKFISYIGQAGHW